MITNFHAEPKIAFALKHCHLHWSCPQRGMMPEWSSKTWDDARMGFQVSFALLLRRWPRARHAKPWSHHHLWHLWWDCWKGLPQSQSTGKMITLQGMGDGAQAEGTCFQWSLTAYALCSIITLQGTVLSRLQKRCCFLVKAALVNGACAPSSFWANWQNPTYTAVQFLPFLVLKTGQCLFVCLFFFFISFPLQKEEDFSKKRRKINKKMTHF